MRASGMHPVEPVEPLLRQSGRLVRFRCDGDKRGRKNGWAVLHLDAHPAGRFGHYRLGIDQRWHSGATVGLNHAERRAMADELARAQRQRQMADLARWQATAERAALLWASAAVADPGHPYLVRKGILAEGVRQKRDELIVPMADTTGKLWNIQRIDGDGGKLFLKDGRTAGLSWQCGGTAGPLCIGEGFATMVAVRRATGHAVCAALSAHNLEPVALAMRSAFPGRDMILCADHDGEGGRNVGMEKATAAARLIGARLAKPTLEAAP